MSDHTVTCPKCQGSKRIRAFSHIEGGICFMCAGNGVVPASKMAGQRPTEAQRAASAAETAKKRAWLLRATEQQLEALTYKQIWSAKMFVSACIVNGDTQMKAVEAAVNRAFEKALQNSEQLA